MGTYIFYNPPGPWVPIVNEEQWAPPVPAAAGDRSPASSLGPASALGVPPAPPGAGPFGRTPFLGPL